MEIYEPGAGANLPPGLFEGDPSAPWNEGYPWEGRRCRDCVSCVLCRMLDGTDRSVCVFEGSADAPREVDPGQAACDYFEDEG